MPTESFFVECQKRHVTPVTLRNYKFCLKALAEWADGKDIDNLPDGELMNFLDANDKPSSYNLYRVVLRMYYAFVRKCDTKDVLKGLKGKKAPIKELRLTAEHVQWFIDACGENYRDRAIIAILAEYGFRAGEIMSIRIKDIDFDATTGGYYLTCPKGKTGTRRVLGINSTKHISAWLQLHPRADDPDAQFICNIDGTAMKGKADLSNRFRRIQKRATRLHPNIPHLHPHLLRHYAATNATKMKMTESSLKLRFGWTPASAMPSRYVHLTNQDSNDEYEELTGNKKKEKKEVVTVQVPAITKCPKCSFENPSGLKFCPRCGSPMDLTTAIERASAYENRMQAMENEMERLIQKIDKLTPGGIRADPDFVEGGNPAEEAKWAAADKQKNKK